jgi:basic amino acid/polyamine antiporter, APA family
LEGGGGKKKIFLRDATGLVREFSSSDAVLLAIGSIAPGFAWAVFATFVWFIYPGVNIPLALFIIAIFALIHGLYYVLISTAMPRSGGGGYVPLSRIIHPAFGLAASFVFVTYMLFTSVFTTTTVSTIVSGQIVSYAFANGNSALQSSASWLTTGPGIFTFATLLLIATGLTVLAGPKTIRIANRIAFGLIIISLIAVVAVLLGTSQGHFQSVYNSYVGSGAYQNVTATASQEGWSIPSNWITPTFVSLPFMFFFILGYEWNTYYSGEIRNVSRSITLAVVLSIAFSAAVYGILSVLIADSFGYNFINSLGFLFNSGSSKYPLPFAAYPNNLIPLVNNNILLSGFLILTFIMAGYYFLVNIFIIVSRHFLGWSFDRVFPSFLGTISPRFHGPVRAVVLMIVISVIITAFYAFQPLVLAGLSVTFFAIAGVLLEGLAGLALPWSRKEIFQSAPALVRKKIGAVPVISLLGLYSLLFVGFLLVEAILNPVIAGPLGIITEGSLIFAFILGLVTYFAYRAYYSRRGVDISLAYKEIPPE